MLPALRSIHPAAEANILRTLEILRDEAEVLDALIDTDPAVERIAALPPALRRLTVQAIAGERRRWAPAQTRSWRWRRAAAPRRSTSAAACGRWSSTGGCGSTTGRRQPPQPARLPVPGAVAFGAGRVTCELVADGPLDADALAPELEVRPWRAGRPRSAARTLQDLFTDRKIPRERRHELPVVVSGGEIAWAIGIIGERFRATESTTRGACALTWDA